MGMVIQGPRQELAKGSAHHCAPGFRWLHDTIGTNWRLTSAAAIGLVQLAKLDQWRALRARNADLWKSALGEVPNLRIPAPETGITHAYYKLYAYVDAGKDGERLRNEILERAQEAGLRVFSGSCSEVYREKAFSDMAIRSCRWRES
jgi:dTDP-4-amino-4,6-dideoxygalactose transaminase